MESRDNLTRRESEVFRQILDGTLPRNNFTQREYEIVKQILDGTLPREIGGVEYGTPMLLQHHVRAIYMKSKESAEKKGSAFNASKEASRAFALAVSSLQKRGLMKGNVLTAAGRREEERKRAEQTPQEIRKKEREYEAILANARKARAESTPPLRRRKGAVKSVRGPRRKSTPKDLKRALAGDKHLRGADLRGADLRGADLYDADLTGADLTGADLTGADIFDAELSDAILTGAILTGAELMDANLPGAKLIGANLTRANLIRADLHGADLTDAILTGAELEAVMYDDSTVWPDGFTPPPPLGFTPPPKTKTRKNPSTDLSAVEQRFMAGYMDAALWTNASSTGISPALEASMLADARKFLSKAEVMLPINEMDRAGHDFWLTRNREGAGFWDGFWGEDGDTLTELAQEFPEVDVYVGDDGLLYG